LREPRRSPGARTSAELTLEVTHLFHKMDPRYRVIDLYRYTQNFKFTIQKSYMKSGTQIFEQPGRSTSTSKFLQELNFTLRPQIERCVAVRLGLR
jgi:hypothetical protein